MSESDIHCPWWAIDSSHTGEDLHVVLVALSQTGDVQGPDSTTVHQIQWDVCDLVISKVIAAQLEDSDSEVPHTSYHSGGDEPPYHIATRCLGHWGHSWGCEGCRLMSIHKYMQTGHHMYGRMYIPCTLRISEHQSLTVTVSGLL